MLRLTGVLVTVTFEIQVSGSIFSYLSLRVEVRSTLHSESTRVETHILVVNIAMRLLRTDRSIERFDIGHISLLESVIVVARRGSSVNSFPRSDVDLCKRGQSVIVTRVVETGFVLTPQLFLAFQKRFQEFRIREEELVSLVGTGR